MIYVFSTGGETCAVPLYASSSVLLSRNTFSQEKIIRKINILLNPVINQVIENSERSVIQCFQNVNQLAVITHLTEKHCLCPERRAWLVILFKIDNQQPIQANSNGKIKTLHH